MTHLIRYTGFTPEERLNEILDKITKYGMESLSNMEEVYLNSYSTYTEDKLHQELARIEDETVFEDDNGKFRFELKYTKSHRNRKDIYGIIYVPDMIYKGETVKGRLEGKISKYKNGNVALYFKSEHPSDECDIFEFCNGVEYELDNFIDYIVDEVMKKGIGY